MKVLFLKACFRDLVRLRYGWMLTKLPATCECGTNFTVDHALSCKKGGFVSQRHNEVRNMTAKYLREVCHDVAVEPILEDLNGEVLPRSSNQSNDARVDVSARGFWVAGQKAFLDVRVFNPLAKRYASLTPSKCYDITRRRRRERIIKGCWKLSTAPSHLLSSQQLVE